MLDGGGFLNDMTLMSGRNVPLDWCLVIGGVWSMDVGWALGFALHVMLRPIQGFLLCKRFMTPLLVRAMISEVLGALFSFSTKRLSLCVASVCSREMQLRRFLFCFSSR